MRRAARSLTALTVIAALTVEMFAGPAQATQRKWHLEHIGAALRDMQSSTTTMDYDRAHAYIAGWTKWDRRKYGTQWYPIVKVWKPCYPPKCVLARTANLPGGGIIHYNAARHRAVVRYRYTPRFVRTHFPQYHHRHNTGSTVAGSGCTGATWWKPWTWCWSQMLPSIWNNLIKPCAAGALGFVAKKWSEKLGAKILYSGESLGKLAGPEGWAAVAVGGCLFGVLFSRVISTTTASLGHVQADRRVEA